MKPLSTEFPLNGYQYRIIERSETRYFAAMFRDAGQISAYETGRIIKRPARDAKIAGKLIHFVACELIQTNNEFGNDPFDCCVMAKNKGVAWRKFLAGDEHDQKNGLRRPKMSIASS